MELIAERGLGIVGERYGSFLEAYRVNDRRPLNAHVVARGDGDSQGLVEADDGIVFTPEDTRRALLYGSDLYAGRYKEMRKRVRKTLLERYEWMDENRFGADVHGEHVIMERYAIGHPEAFHRKRHTIRRERSVEIFYDAMCPASTSVAKRIEAGCIVAACADALERMGYEVALTFCLATYDGNSMSDDPTLLLEVALKGYGDALNVRRLEFPLAAKPVLFHLGVWWAHRFPGAPGDFGEGEGYPVSYDARRVHAMEEHARRRHGAYLSEDILEMQLGMDPTRALERILGAVGEEDVLEQHMVQKSTMQASESPSQGKLFGGVRAPEAAPDARRASGEGGTERTRETRERPGDAGVGEGAPQDAGEGPDESEASGAGAVSDAGDGPDEGEASGAPGAGGSPGSPGDEGLREREQTGRQRSGGEARSGAADGPEGSGDQKVSSPAPQPGGAGEENGADIGGQAPGGSQTGGDAENGKDADDEAGDADGDGGSAGSTGDDARDPSGTDDGPATAGSGGGASTPSGAGNADSPGGGGSGEECPSERDDDPEDDEDEDEQGEAMDDDTGEERQERDSEDAKRSEEEPPEDQQPERGADEEEPERDSFIVELRKRYARFERGDYRRMKEREAREAKADTGSTGRGPVQAPPAAPVTGADDYEFGTPRSTPFSMNYVPKRKG